MTPPGPRAGKGRSDGLSQAVIVQAALTVARRLGLEGFSMRDLAGELGVTQMAAYYYVSSRDELVALVGDEILAQVRRPESGSPEPPGSPAPPGSPGDVAWDVRARALVTDTVAALRPWKDSGAVMLRTCPREWTAILRALTDVLRCAGFDDAEARLATRMLQAWALGELGVRHHLDEVAEAAAAAAAAAAADAPSDPGEEGGAGDKRTAVPPAPDADEDHVTAFTLDVILDGLRARLAACRPDDDR